MRCPKACLMGAYGVAGEVRPLGRSVVAVVACSVRGCVGGLLVDGFSCWCLCCVRAYAASAPCKPPGWKALFSTPSSAQLPLLRHCWRARPCSIVMISIATAGASESRLEAATSTQRRGLGSRPLPGDRPGRAWREGALTPWLHPLPPGGHEQGERVPAGWAQRDSPRPQLRLRHPTGLGCPPHGSVQLSRHSHVAQG